MPNNALTRLIERASQRNEGMREVPVDAGASPSARSAAVGRVTEEQQLPPLTPEERAELDQKAREMGALPRGEGEEGQYDSLEAALAAGAPIPAPDAPVEVRQTAREFIATRGSAVQAMMGSGERQLALHPRLPDFTRIGGIDLIRNVVYVDGMEFPLPPSNAAEFRMYVIQLVGELVTAQLNGALMAIAQAMAPVATTEEEDGAQPAAEGVQPVSNAEGTDGVQPPQ